jgi:hypothetical protein
MSRGHSRRAPNTVPAATDPRAPSQPPSLAFGVPVASLAGALDLTWREGPVVGEIVYVAGSDPAGAAVVDGLVSVLGARVHQDATQTAVGAELENLLTPSGKRPVLCEVRRMQLSGG